MKKVIFLGLILALCLMAGPMVQPALAQKEESVPQLPEVLFPCTYRGTVTHEDGRLMPDGTEVYAQIGDWRSPSVEVVDGKYRLPVRPPKRSYFGKIVVFFAGEKICYETAVFPNTHDPNEERFPTHNLTVSTPGVLPNTGADPLKFLWMWSALGVVFVLCGVILCRQKRRA